MHTKSGISIAIIIPVLNEQLYLPTLIDSIKKQSIAPSQVIVVDSKSIDKTISICESQTGIVSYVRSAVPGVAAQRNYGAEKSNSQILCFVDADVVLPSDFVAKIQHYYSQSATRQSTALYPMYLPNTNNIFLLLLFTIQNIYCYMVQWFKPVWSGSTMIIPRQLFEQTAGFNSAVQFEDVEFAHRLSKIARLRLIPVITRFSTRRFREDGIIRITTLYLVTIFLSLFGLHMPAHSVSYRFGEHN